jgi:multicomponent Na+:H+ antiporter subunit D
VLAPGLILVVVSVAVGLGAAFAVDYGAMAAEQAMDVAGYVADVCGASGCDAALTAALK